MDLLGSMYLAEKLGPEGTLMFIAMQISVIIILLVVGRILSRRNK